MTKKKIRRLSKDDAAKRYAYARRLLRAGKTGTEIIALTEKKHGVGVQWGMISQLKKELEKENGNGNGEVVVLDTDRRLPVRVETLLKRLSAQMSAQKIDRLSLTSKGNVTVRYEPEEEMFEVAP